MATFNSFVFDVTSQTPQQIGPSLSGANNSVILTKPLSSSVYGGKRLAGILYDLLPSAGTATVNLSVLSNIQFRVHPSYNGATFALYFTDRSTTLFTVNTALTSAQSVSGVAGFAHRGPNERRRFAIEL